MKLVGIKTLASITLAALAACVAHPAGEREERDRALEVGKQFDEQLAPPALPDNPSAEDYLHTAFFANAELQQRYWEWRSALERIPQDASPPNAALTFGYLFGDGQMKAWDRTTLGITNDPMTNVPLPSKLAVAGRRALEEARAAGLRFEAAKFRLQAEVLKTYYDLALHSELLRTQEAMLRVLEVAQASASAGTATGGSTAVDLVRAGTELELARNDLANLHSQLPPLAARMNALIGRPPDAKVPLPNELPEPRPLSASDEEIVHFAAQRSPELAALDRDIAGREEALELARKARLPDFNLSFSITGTISQMLGGMLVLPTRTEAIDAGIEQARDDLRAAQAARTQYSRDLTASFVLDLYVLRNAERQVALFREVIVPRAELLGQTSLSSLAPGRGRLVDALDSQRMLLDSRLTLATMRIEREKALTAIETWTELDVEALHPMAAGTAAVR